MGHWYPAQRRVEILSAELQKLEAFALEPADDVAATVATVSATLSIAAQREGFPQRQLRQWTWLGSRYRMHAARGGPIASAAGGALAFLNKRVVGAISSEDVQDLNWVLETTIAFLRAGADDDSESYLSPAELTGIAERLNRLETAPYNEAAVRAAAAHPIAELEVFSLSPHLQGVGAKIEALFDAARHDGLEGRIARAALLYLAEDKDVVADSEGFLGLMDDVYVIDLAFARVEQQTRCLPILNGLLADLPYVGEVALVGEPPRPLDLYGQYVVCAVLDSLRTDAAPTMLVVREVGPFAFLAAFFAAVRSSREEASIDRARLDAWPVGQPVVISDGANSFKAVFYGEETIGKKRCFRLGVDKSASLNVPADLAPYISAAAAPHRRLSAGTDIGVWLKSRHVDPLVNLTGSARTRRGEQTGILLLGARSKLDAYINFARPLGSNVGALVGLRYVSSTTHEDLSGTATDTPYIYACSDAATAYELVRNPPAHIRGWRVIVDGARAMRSLHASLSTDGQGNLPPMCVLAELHDRELSSEVLQRGFNVWYLEDHDVRPPGAAVEASGQSDILDRVVSRQSAHWHAVQIRHLRNHPFLEAVDAWMVRASEKRVDDSIQNLGLLIAAFMRSALARPTNDQVPDAALQTAARTIAQHAGGLRNYAPLAAEAYELFAPFLHEPLPQLGKIDALLALSFDSTPSRVAVVCRSVSIAAACGAAARSNGLTDRVFWTNLEGVRAQAPFDRIVVPGWLDRLSMRELASNGYGKTLELILYPFEQRWFDKTVAAGARWERRIEAGTLKALSSVSARLTNAGREAPMWRSETWERLQAVVTSKETTDPLEVPEADAPEFERLEGQNVGAVQRAALIGREGHPTARAQLVMFDDPGRHIFLRAGGRVIVLAGPGIDQRATTGGDAEKLLYRSVDALEPGWVLAIAEGGDRDLVDARADLFIQDAPKVRALAEAWKVALRRYMNRMGLEAAAVARRLREAGVSRDTATVRYWTTNSTTVAPRGYKDVIPVIARLTMDDDLKSSQTKVLAAIECIYRARSRAAEAIVQELFSGAIDLDARHLAFEIGGAVVQYGLHTVQSLEGLCDVPVEILGRIRTLAAQVQPAAEDVGASA